MSSTPTPPSDGVPEASDSSPAARGATGRQAVAGLLGLAHERWDSLLQQHGRWRVAAVGLLLILIASPWPPLTVAALVAYLAVTLKQPGLTVALLPFAAPFAYVPKDLFGPSLPVVELLLLVAIITSGLQLVVRWRRQAAAGTAAAATLDAWDATRGTLRTSFGMQGAALALIASFSLLTVADQGHLRESLREYRTVVIEPVIYFFLALYWLRNRELRGIAIAAFIAGAAVVATIGVGQVVTGQNVVAAEGVRRATGLYQHPNALALYLVRALPFALALLALAPDPRRHKPLLLGSAVITLGLLLTFSRGAFIGLAIALVLLAALVTRQAIRLGILGGVIVGGGIVFLVSGTRLDSLVEGGGSLELRRLLWGSTVAMIRNHPAFGVGLDQFLYQYAPRYIHPAAWEEKFTSHPHNLFLDFWVRLGIMGLAWIGWLLLSGAARFWRGLQAIEAPAQRRLLIATGIACGAAFIHGLVDNFYFLIDLAFVWWFFLALIQITTDTGAFQGTAANAADNTVAATATSRRRGKQARNKSTQAAAADEQDRLPGATGESQDDPIAEPTEGW